MLCHAVGCPLSLEIVQSFHVPFYACCSFFNNDPSWFFLFLSFLGVSFVLSWLPLVQLLLETQHDYFTRCQLTHCSFVSRFDCAEMFLTRAKESRGPCNGLLL